MGRLGIQTFASGSMFKLRRSILSILSPYALVSGKRYPDLSVAVSNKTTARSETVLSSSSSWGGRNHTSLQGTKHSTWRSMAVILTHLNSSKHVFDQRVSGIDFKCFLLAGIVTVKGLTWTLTLPFRVHTFFSTAHFRTYSEQLLKESSCTYTATSCFPF